MKVYIVTYFGLEHYPDIQKVFSAYKAAEAYVLSNGGFSSEIHNYEIEEMEVN